MAEIGKQKWTRKKIVKAWPKKKRNGRKKEKKDEVKIPRTKNCPTKLLKI